MSAPKDPKEHWYPGFESARQTDVIRRRGLLSSLAEERLAELLDLGLHAKERSSEEEHLVRLGERRQPVWLKFGYEIDRWGVERVKVEGETLMADTAIIAALTNTENTSIDMERLREMLPNVEALMRSGKCGSLGEALDRMGSTRGDQESYRLRLLKHFRPELDSYPIEDQIALYEETCERINKLLEASRKLVGFLEYGKPNSDLRPEVENVEHDVNAAVLRDAGGLTYLQIGEALDMSPPAERYRNEGDHPTVRQLVRRGRRILEQAFGKEGWTEKAETMKAEAKQRRDRELRLAALIIADKLGVPEEEVSRNLTWSPASRKLTWLDENLRERCLNEFCDGNEERFKLMFS